MFGAMKSFFGRTGKSAIAGGVIGGMAGGGDWKNIAGGAAGGAAMGMFGANRLSGLNIAGGLRKGIQYGRKATIGAERAAWSGFDKFGGNALGNAMGRTALAANSARSGMGTARSFIGNNAARVNKYGGQAAVAAGIGSAALLGSSLINSNRGY